MCCKDRYVYICIMEKVWYGPSYKLGVLGGGQLGRMLIQAALSYDVQVHVMDASEDFPCGKIAHSFTCGDIQNFDDVIAFGKDKDVITVEIEHVNVDALEQLESEGVKVFPQPRVLRLIQDKGEQKKFYREKNIPTAPFELVEHKNEIPAHYNLLPFVQKMRKGGYDGKGVYKFLDESAFEQAFDVPSVLEQFVDFEKELSVIVARNEDGEMKTFPLVECEFNPTLNLVEFLFSPANVSPAVEEEAERLAKKIITELDMVGILAVELFLTKEGKLLVNEIAPRTHNSGHHTIECNKTSQFEQHLRAITNQPLGSTKMTTAGVMINLLGHTDYAGAVFYEGLSNVMQKEGVFVHVYGKAETKPNRKMGHVTITDTRLSIAKEVAREVQGVLQVKSTEANK